MSKVGLRGRVIGLVFAGSALLIAATLGAARASAAPGPVADAGFAECEGRSCFRGVVPGETLWVDAFGLLRVSVHDALPIARAFLLDHIVVRVNPSVSLSRDVDGVSLDSRVDTLRVSPYRRNLPDLGSFMEHYGLPCSVSLPGNNSPVLLVHFRHLTLWVDTAVADGRLDPRIPVAVVQMDNSPASERSRCSANPLQGTIWRGMTTWSHYAAR